jgi:hypothetical protein
LCRVFDSLPAHQHFCPFEGVPQPKLQPTASKPAACPFSNLPDASKGRWGTGVTADKMKACRWPKPQIVVALDFLEVDAGRPPATRLFRRTAPRQDPAFSALAEMVSIQVRGKAKT